MSSIIDIDNKERENTFIKLKAITWMDSIIADVKALVEIETWRDGNNEEKVQENLEQIYNYFVKKMNNFNGENSKYNINSFDWKSKDKKYRVFGFRAGAGLRKVSLICHLDTVPPGNDAWKPFEPRVETRLYKGVPTKFLIGRGAIDDKGPAVVAFDAFTRALQEARENTGSLDDVTLEVLFDTSEETDMSTPQYFKENPEEMPAFGIVFDALWSIRAEKGIERPEFTIKKDDVEHPENSTALVITQLSTPTGSTNMIPATFKATISGASDKLQDFTQNVEKWYRSYQFDDPDYHPADINVSIDEDGNPVITANVAGAQHGSAPHQNRVHGANPVVSLTNFLASLIDRGILANNYNGEMCRFIRWAFGTRVFGENHPDLLYRFDTIFGEGNGTTYGLTQLNSNDSSVTLAIDIRYAIGHHATGWDGSEGQIDGPSLFASVFERLVKRYKSETGGATISYKTLKEEDAFGPDIRSPRNEDLFRINMAYRSIMGDNCPMLAIGGATDAHGYTNLVTAGSLFTDSLGPPINYHGLDEGAPLIDLENSGKILLYLLKQELNLEPTEQSHHGGIHHGCGCAL